MGTAGVQRGSARMRRSGSMGRVLIAATCESCGRGLSLLQRGRGRRFCDECTAKAEAESGTARAEYPMALQAVIDGGADSPSLVDRLRELERTIAAGGGDVSTTKTERYDAYLRQALADETLSRRRRGCPRRRRSRALLRSGAACPAERVVRVPLAVVRGNGERWAAARPVRRADRPEARGSAAPRRARGFVQGGDPARMALGIMGHVLPGDEGRVVSGWFIARADGRGRPIAGSRWIRRSLCVTSSRVVYTGTRKTMEMPYSKFLDINVYTDAIQIHVTNRQNPPIFRVADGPMVAAAIDAAMQRTL